MRGLARYDQFRARRWERQVLSKAAAIVAVTESDAKTLSALSGRPAHVVSNGVDTRGFAHVQPDAASRTVLFVGNYEYAPNVDAVEWALTEVWPRVWPLVPDARFRICGHGLPEAWRQRFTDPRIEWLGYVPDLTEVQSRSAAFLAPLRYGGGSKLKVLEAMAASLPLISTAEGLSGLNATAGVHALVADTPEAIAQAIAHTLANPASARAMGLAAREHVTQQFDWARSASQLEAVYQSLQTATKVAA